jgi:16S rRNA (cytidine1402-2'-O)-methyltransferase
LKKGYNKGSRKVKDDGWTRAPPASIIRVGMPTLYLVATPIGNLGDLSGRAIRVLSEVGLVAAEDTRKTRRLLTAHGIKTPLTSYHEQGTTSKLPYVLERLDEVDVALVSEAGTPGISDPGYELVRAAIDRGVKIVGIPGPSVVPVALAVSGLPASQYVFLGFLPRTKGARSRLLSSVSTETRTLVMFEAPHRLLASLADMKDILGERQLAVCRELTKVHEEVFRGTVAGALDYFVRPRGEFTLVVAGCEVGKVMEEVPGLVARELWKLRNAGVPAREAVAALAARTGIPRRALYRAWIELS